MDYLQNCMSCNIMNEDFYEKTLKSENDIIKIYLLLEQQTNLFDLIITTYTMSNKIQLKINNDIIIIFVIILLIILCMFRLIKQAR
jgi:hypothetical protein